MTLQSKTAIHRGDFIEVKHQDENGVVDLLVRGTALTDIHLGGTSLFSVRPPQIHGGGATPDLHLNCNYVDVRLLFAANQLEGSEPTA